MIRALIVEDEELSRGKLTRLLDEHPDVRVIGEAGSGAEAIALLRAERPQLVFLDIDLPDMTGFEVLEAVAGGPTPLVIFVTAYDEHAIRAFDVHAVDYLLKPFVSERMSAALERARGRLGGAPGAAMEPLLALLHEMRARQRQLEARLDAESRPGRLAVRDGAETVFVRITDIDRLESADNYVSVHVGPKRYLVRGTLGAMAKTFDERRFTRIHRGIIVNDDRVDAFRPGEDGALEIVLRDGAVLPIGRSFRERVMAKWHGVPRRA